MFDNHDKYFILNLAHESCKLSRGISIFMPHSKWYWFVIFKHCEPNNVSFCLLSVQPVQISIHQCCSKKKLHFYNYLIILLSYEVCMNYFTYFVLSSLRKESLTPTTIQYFTLKHKGHESVIEKWKQSN